jgi:hypothetical protein
MQFAVQRAIVEHEHVALELESHATLADGTVYHNVYCFLFKLRGGRIVATREHANTACAAAVLPPRSWSGGAVTRGGMQLRMKAAVFLGPRHLEVRSDVSRPRIDAHEVLVQVHACGICGSDLHIYRVQTASTDAMRQSGTLLIDAEGHAVPGHEFSGVIVEAGAEVTGYRVGDRVAGATGGGGMAEYMPVPAHALQLVHVPDNVSFEEAATVDPLAAALQMVRLARVAPDEHVVVFGVGIIGLGVIQVLRALGRMPVTSLRSTCRKRVWRWHERWARRRRSTRPANR